MSHAIASKADEIADIETAEGLADEILDEIYTDKSITAAEGLVDEILDEIYTDKSITGEQALALARLPAVMREGIVAAALLSISVSLGRLSGERGR